MKLQKKVTKKRSSNVKTKKNAQKLSNKFIADSEKLKLICKGQKVSLRELSLRIGHAPGWLSQRINVSKSSPKFTMSTADAKRIADVLEFRTDDFSAPEEKFTTPIVYSLQAECKDFIAKLPADRRHLVNKFMNFVRSADTSDLARLQDFFQQPTTPTQLVSNRKAASSWLYSYVLKHAQEVFYPELEKSLFTPDDNSLQEALTSITGSSRGKLAAMSKESAAKFDVSGEIETRLKSYLRFAISDSLEDAWESTREHILDDCVRLLRQYECSIPEAVAIVNDIKVVTHKLMKSN